MNEIEGRSLWPFGLNIINLELDIRRHPSAVIHYALERSKGIHTMEVEWG